MSESRALTEPERAMIAAAREKAYILYEGKQVPHRSCGIALAETFDLPTRPYQALRRGGITGCGACGAIRAGSPDIVCNNLTAQFGDFRGPARHQFCTNLAAEVATLTAETLVCFAPEGTAIHVGPIAGLPSPASAPAGESPERGAP